MQAPPVTLPPLAKSLTARVLLLAVAFLLIGEVLIYVPSIARYRLVYLSQRIEAAHLATLTLEAAPEGRISKALEQQLLERAKVQSVVLRRPKARHWMLGEPSAIEGDYALDQASTLTLILDAFETLAGRQPRIIRVVAPTAMEPGTRVEVTLNDGAMRREMIAFSWRILALSVVLSVIVGSVLLVGLHGLMIRPMRRLTERMVGFRMAPEDVSQIIVPSDRSDEIGVAQRELAMMQNEVRQALTQKNRLAALGTAVSKINHDLRNILSTAVMMSDSLADSVDPKAQRQATRLFGAIDRAVKICTQTLDYAHVEQPLPMRTRFGLKKLVDDVCTVLPLQSDAVIEWHNDVAAEIDVNADRDQLFRVLMNLCRNAAEAMAEGGHLTVAAQRHDGAVIIDVADTGPGLPDRAKDHLFEAFTGSLRVGGTGLGLAIARDLMRAHGGDIALAESGAQGTRFRLTLPDS